MVTVQALPESSLLLLRCLSDSDCWLEPRMLGVGLTICRWVVAHFKTPSHYDILLLLFAFPSSNSLSGTWCKSWSYKQGNSDTRSKRQLDLYSHSIELETKHRQRPLATLFTDNFAREFKYSLKSIMCADRIRVFVQSIRLPTPLNVRLPIVT